MKLWKSGLFALFMTWLCIGMANQLLGADEGPKAAFKEIKKRLDAKKVKSAHQLMTEKAKNQIMTDAVMSVIVASTEMEEDVDQMPPEMAAQMKGVVQQSSKLYKKYGLDKFELNMDVIDIEEMNDSLVQLQKQLTKAFPKQSERWKMMEECREATRMMSPDVFSGKIEGVEVSDDRATLTVTPKLPLEMLEEENVVVAPSVLIFKKVDGKWMFDGEDYELSMKAADELFGSMDGGDMRKDQPILEDFDFAGETVDGKVVDIKDYNGKVTLVDFWGTWCGPCVAAFPKLKNLKAAFKGFDFEIVGIALDDEPTLKAFLKKTELPWNNVVDAEGDISKDFGISVFPTTLLLDKTGKHFESNLEGSDLVDAIAEKLGLNADQVAKVKARMETSKYKAGKKEEKEKKEAKEEADNSTDRPAEPAVKREFVNEHFEAPIQLSAEDQPIQSEFGYISPAIFDIDRDGKDELVIGDILGELRFCENRGSVEDPEWTQPQPVVDVNNDPIRLNNW